MLSSQKIRERYNRLYKEDDSYDEAEYMEEYYDRKYGE